MSAAVAQLDEHPRAWLRRALEGAIRVAPMVLWSPHRRHVTKAFLDLASDAFELAGWAETEADLAALAFVGSVVRQVHEQHGREAGVVVPLTRAT